MTFVVNPESSNIRPLPSCCTCMNYESLFQVPVNLYIFSFRIGVSNSFSSSVEISKQKSKSDFNFRGMTDLQESDSRLASAAEMVLALDLNFERAKAGDVGKCYNTNICNRPLQKWFFILMQIRLTFTRRPVHLASLWKWGFLKLGTGLFTFQNSWSHTINFQSIFR